MEVCRTIDEMREARPGAALVPTMGALHEGHLAHVDAAKRAADRVVVSIFVNPTQFGPGEDYQRYPRALEADLQRCEAAGVWTVFAPPPVQMYPTGAIDAAVDVPGLTAEFEGAKRPGHFAGVCRVVLKLLNIVQPGYVTFGQKDYQQLRVCEAMIADLALPVEVIRVPTVREPDGLALSSRNAYLDDAQRRHALGLIHALTHARRRIVTEFHTDPVAIEAAMQRTIDDAGLTLDYAALRDPQTLEPLHRIDRQVVALVAGRLGQVRLLDNQLIAPPTA